MRAHFQFGVPALADDIHRYRANWTMQSGKRLGNYVCTCGRISRPLYELTMCTLSHRRRRRRASMPFRGDIYAARNWIAYVCEHCWLFATICGRANIALLISLRTARAGECIKLKCRVADADKSMPTKTSDIKQVVKWAASAVVRWWRWNIDLTTWQIEPNRCHWHCVTAHPVQIQRETQRCRERAWHLREMPNRPRNDCECR